MAQRSKIAAEVQPQSEEEIKNHPYDALPNDQQDPRFRPLEDESIALLRRVRRLENRRAGKGELNYIAEDVLRILTQCRFDHVPPPFRVEHVLDFLLRRGGVLKGERVVRDDKRDQWKQATEIEARAAADPRGRYPSVLSANALAVQVDVSHNTARRWRAMSEYRHEVERQRRALGAGDG